MTQYGYSQNGLENENKCYSKPPNHALLPCLFLYLLLYFSLLPVRGSCDAFFVEFHSGKFHLSRRACRLPATTMEMCPLDLPPRRNLPISHEERSELSFPQVQCLPEARFFPGRLQPRTEQGRGLRAWLFLSNLGPH